MVDLIILGTIGLDSVKTPFGKIKEGLGGAAVYASVAASFFSKPGIVSIMGEDFPEAYLQFLSKKGIDLSGIEKQGKTFRWDAFYEFDMNEAKTIKTELNSLESFKADLPDNYKDAKYVFLANIDPELQMKVIEQLKNPEFIVLDTMNFWIENKKEELIEVIKQVNLLLLNESEARQLFNTPFLIKAAKEALKLGPKAVIIKKGEHGSLLFTDDKYFSAPGYPLEEIKDPTGCGDSFGGALIGYLAKTKDTSEANLRKAIVYGSVIASYNAEDFSLNRLKTLTEKDIEKRYNEFHDIRKF